MLKKFLLFFVFILISILPILKVSADSNSGFVSGNIWYSQDSFKEGDTIKIHTIVYNSDSRELSGTVFFFDKTLFLGNRSIAIPPKSSTDVSVDWKVTAGDHTIFAQIQKPKFLLASGKYEEASLKEIKSDESKITVEKTNNIKENNTEKNTVSNNSDSILNIVKNNTPAIISNTISNTTTTLEKVRDDINTLSTKNKKIEKTKLEKLNNTNNTTNKKDPNISKGNTTKIETNQTNMFLKPFTYVKLFFFTLVSFIFDNKLIFYGLFVLLIFFILRFIWRLIF